MKISLATAKDAKEVAALIKNHSQTDYMGYVMFKDTYIKDKMKKNNFFLVTRQADRIVGCIRASIVDLDLAEIRTLCVEEEYRKQGIATELLNEAVGLMKKKGMRKLVARSKSDNRDAIRLFEKAGFEQEGYFREHYRKGIDVVQMAKFL